MNDYKIIGRKIFDARKKLKMSRAELGKKVDLHESTIKRYEDGEIKNVDIDKLREFAKALDISPVYLMGWTDDPENYATLDLNEDTETTSPNSLPSLTPKDEREIAKDLEAMINSLDDKNGMAAYNDPEDEEDRELLKASLLTSMRLAKQIAKKKYTPKKYRKE